MGETLQFVFFFEWPVTLRPGRLKTMLSLVLRPAIKRRTFFLRLPSVYKHNVDYDFFKDSLGNSRYLFVSFYVIKKKCILLYCNVKNLNVNVIFLSYTNTQYFWMHSVCGLVQYVSNTGEFTKRVRMMSSHLFVTLYIHYLSIPLHTIRWYDIIQTLFVNSPVGEETQLSFGS